MYFNDDGDEISHERCEQEQEQEQEQDVRQLAQVSVGGVYRYELEWLPETHEIRVEIDHFRDGSPMYYWYPDSMGTIEVLSNLLSVPEEKIRITGLTFFTEESEDDPFDCNRWRFPHNIWRDAFECEQWLFPKKRWREYAEDGTAMQFNVEIICPHKCYDAACDGTNCDFKPFCYDPACVGTNCELRHVPPFHQLQEQEQEQEQQAPRLAIKTPHINFSFTITHPFLLLQFLRFVDYYNENALPDEVYMLKPMSYTQYKNLMDNEFMKNTPTEFEEEAYELRDRIGNHLDFSDLASI